MFHLVYRIGAKLLSNWEKAWYTLKLAGFTLKVSFLACEFVFYRQEHNVKRGNPMELYVEGLQTQK